MHIDMLARLIAHPPSALRKPLHHAAHGPPPRDKLGEELFAATALRLSGQAGALLGWRPREFWSATPVELAAILHALAGEATAPPAAADLARLQEMFPDG